MNLRLVSSSAEATRGIGAALGRAADSPLALLLTGDYGSGKTTFVQGLARGLDIAGPVRSPSYNILKRYQGRLPLVHADLYRTNSAPEIDELGIGEILAADGVLAVEWPGQYQPPPTEMPLLLIDFSYADAAGPEDTGAEMRRVLEFSWKADLPEAIQAVLNALAA